MLIIISIVIYIITSKIMYPLQELNDSTKSIAEGKYDRRVEIYSHDEVGQLSENFNKMVDAIEVKTNSLVESERKKTLFMGNLTHELKTPLTAISGYAQTLLSVKLSEEDREEALSYIYEESCRLERLSRKMMNILFLEEEAPLELAPVTAAELFERVAVSCSGVLEDKHITLVCREAGETFMVDSDLMTEVLINLVDNGIKASQEGSQIILTAGENMISVQDFGKGIPEEEQDKILEPFYMIDKSRSRKKGGAGLGLAITASILKKHNCTLEIDSRLGEGTCMKITICL
jgi:signal transduction histidine kinase